MRSVLLPLFHVLKQSIPKADIYHSVSAGYAGVVGGLAKYINNKPFIVTEHGIYTREREEEIIKSDWLKSYFKSIWIEFFYSLSRCAYEHADKVVTLFNKNKEIEMELGCEEEKILVIPNGVNLSKYGNLKKRDPNDKTFNVGAIIRMVPIKDIKTMLQSFAVVNKEIDKDKIKFYVMGPTEEDEEYFEECKEFKEILELDNVVFTGRINIMDYLDTMDLLVLTSISEGQPLAVLEGMICKKAYVTTDVGSCKELLYGVDDDYGKAGIVAPVMDYDRIGKSIISLFMDEKRRKAMEQAAYKRVNALYSLDIFIDGYKKLYKDIYNEFNGKGI
jgi:glycosyltransferase involved in cell wall biosynthesis